MFSRWKRKGMANQVDWAISMAIFLLFIIWFFVIIRQYVPLTARLESNILLIEEKFKDDVSYEYKQIPIYLTAQKALSDVPIIIANPVNWTNYLIDDGSLGIYAKRDGTNMFLIADVVSGKNVIMMKTSQLTYQQPQPTNFLYNVSESVIVNENGFNPRFQDDVLDELYYNSTQYIYDLSFLMNDNELTQTTGSSIQEGIFYKAVSLFDWFTVTSYVFPDNSYVETFFDVSEGLSENATFAVEVTMPKVASYATDIYTTYLLNLDSGCITRTSDLLDLINGNEGLTFIFDDDATFTICDASDLTGDYITVKAEFTYDASSGITRTPFMIYAHEDTYADTFSDIVSIQDMSVGTVETFSGISKSALDELQSYSKKEMYTALNISDSYDFSIDVYNASDDAIFSFSTEEDVNVDVFSRSFTDYLIDSYGNKERVMVSIRVW